MDTEKNNRTVSEIVEQSIAEQEEIEANQIEILPAKDVEMMSMAKIHQEKQMLSQRRNVVMLKMDSRRLRQAEKIMDEMDIALDRMTGYYNKNGDLIHPDPMQFKLLTDGYKNLLDCLNKISRLDSVDTGGKAGRISIDVRFKSE